MEITKKRIVITGSQGRIGRILVGALASDYDVRGIDCTGQDDGSDTTFIRLDLSDYNLLEKTLLKLGQIACLIHLAAQRHVSDHWDLVLRNTIMATRNIYEASRAVGIKKIIYASSNQVTAGYETDLTESESQLISVEHQVRPTSNYATCKVFGEAIARQYWEAHRVRSICLRIGTVRDDDNPRTDPTGRWMRTWLSHRDLVQLVRKTINADVNFGIYYGVSNNTGRFWDISNAQTDLGYTPVDDSARIDKAEARA
jgi:nucleoside-diphosphate-sugar epimerase